MRDLLQDLNEPQRRAVTTTEGPVLVVAGAGSGKTRVITYRVAYLIGARRVSPYNILAVTFTNKAAEEMRNRLYRLLGTSDLEAWISTYHSLCAHLLRREAHRLDYKRNFGIYDESDQLSLIKHCMKDLQLAERDYNPHAILAHIGAAKAAVLDPEGYTQLAGSLFEEQVARVYVAYQQTLRSNNVMDFDDLLKNMLKILMEFPDCADKYRRLFRYVLVDEFQDTNRVQYEIVRELAKEHRNLCVVGDEDQSIYSWRGANIENLFDLQKDFPDAVPIFLEENYRSTRRILDVANAIIENNRRRKPKRLWTKNEEGEKIEWYAVSDEYDEARLVIEIVYRLQREKPELKNNDIAVFYRTNAQSRVIEDQLRSAGIPYVIVGGVRFYDRKEIKDVMAYLKVIANPSDNVSLRRIINTPPRGIGKTTLDRLEEFASRERIYLFEAMGRAGEMPNLRADARQNVLGFRDYLLELTKKSNGMTAQKLIEEVIETSGYQEMLRQDPSFEAKGRLENLGELLSAAAEFAEESDDPSLDAFLERTALRTDIDEWDEARDLITLMTLHMAKGLEFPVVIMTGMEEGLFPHINTLDSEAGLEEERRLCYVGITRARKRVILTSAEIRRIRGAPTPQVPSRFISEIPDELLESYGSAPDRIHDEYYQEMPDYDGDRFRVGDVVEHSAFGTGRIRSFSGSGDKLKVAVQFFRDNRQRDLLVKFASLKKK